MWFVIQYLHINMSVKRAFANFVRYSQLETDNPYITFFNFCMIFNLLVLRAHSTDFKSFWCFEALQTCLNTYWNAPRALRQAETRVMWPVGYSRLENRNYRKRYNKLCTEIRGNIPIYGFLGLLRNYHNIVMQFNARQYWICV